MESEDETAIIGPTIILSGSFEMMFKGKKKGNRKIWEKLSCLFAMNHQQCLKQNDAYRLGKLSKIFNAATFQKKRMRFAKLG